MYPTRPPPSFPEGTLPSFTAYKDALHSCVRGYPKLAQEMEQFPPITIFRRFAALNARANGYGSSFQQLELRDSLSDKGRRKEYARNAATLQDSVAPGDPAQWTMMLQIREKLEKYNKALLYQSQICKLPYPNDYDIRDIRAFIHRTSVGMDSPFTGLDGQTWGTLDDPDTQADDLITLKPRKKEDAFSTFVAEHASWYLKWPLRLLYDPTTLDSMIMYSDATISRITYTMVAVIAGLAPILSVYILTTLHTMKARLCMLTAFNVGIAVCLQIFTDARGTDLFIVTAV